MNNAELEYGKYLCEQAHWYTQVKLLLDWANDHPWKAKFMDKYLGLKVTPWYRCLVGSCALAIKHWALQEKSLPKPYIWVYGDQS